MIFGDPSKFAIQMDVVKAWSSPPTFIEGVVNVYINGFLLNGRDVYTSSIYQDYIDIVKGVLNNPPIVNNEEFTADVICVLPRLLKSRYPFLVYDSHREYEEMPDEWTDGVHDDLSNDATFETLSRKRYNLFVIKFNKKVRLIIIKFELNDEDYYDISKLRMTDIEEIIVDEFWLINIINDMENWYCEIQKVMCIDS